MGEAQQLYKVENCGTKWRDIVQKIRYDLFGKFLRTIAHHAALHPLSYVFSIALLSFGIAITGLFTNFYLDKSDYDQWTPAGSYPEQHRDWYRYESNFPSTWRTTSVLVHHVDGNNVATREGLEVAFEALDVVLQVPAYQEVCGSVDGEHNPCFLTGVTKFWDNDSTLFHKQIQQQSPGDIIATISQETYPDGFPVEVQRAFGKPGILWDHIVVFVQAFDIMLAVPDSEEAMELEKQIIDALLDFRQENRDNQYQVEIFASRSFGDEFTRAILRDLPLMPVAFMLMSLFTMIAFSKRHPVLSRSLLGFGAVCCVFLSILSGFGLMFCIGVEFASMNQILPFVLFGIGLDDTFIILGAFVRTNPKKPVIDRIDESIEDVGSSIALTTITSSLAFGLGALSGIPAVKSLCHYAYTTILIIFLYQITFFVALLALDERRIQANRRNCLPCWFSTFTISTSSRNTAHDHTTATGKMSELSRRDPQQLHYQQAQESARISGVSSDGNNNSEANNGAHMIDRIMVWYAKKLLKPWVKVAVIALFSAWFGLCLWSALQLTQEFKFTEVLPRDSYLVDYVRKAEEYSDAFIAPFPSAFFRCVDQSDPNIQDQMIAYVDELVNEMDEITQEPKFFWLRDFRAFIDQYANGANGLADLPFNEQLDFFLEIPIFHQLYNHKIVRDERTGDIITSSVMLLVDNVDQEDVDDVVEALQNQREITINQHINTVEGLSDRIVNAPYCENMDETDFAFFLYHVHFQNWEFYSVAVYELMSSTIAGIIAVTIVGILLIPHWTAGLFVLPLICILYVDVLGILQLAGAHINAVTYVSMVMSIGLMVDFIMHVMLRYYECESRLSRHEKVIETLGTMGSSVLLGGTSSLVGVLPLWGTSSIIIQTIFKAFITLVVVGLSHGLIFLPVVLSIAGPLDTLPSKTLSLSVGSGGEIVAAADNVESNSFHKPEDHHAREQQREQHHHVELQHEQEQPQELQLQEQERPKMQQQQQEQVQLVPEFPLIQPEPEEQLMEQQQEEQLRQQQQQEQPRPQQEERLRQQQQQEDRLRQQQQDDLLRQQQQGDLLRQQQQVDMVRQQHHEELLRQQQQEDMVRQQQHEELLRQRQQEDLLSQQQQEDLLSQQQQVGMVRQQQQEDLPRQQQQEDMVRQQQQEEVLRRRQQQEQLMQQQQEYLMQQQQQERLRQMQQEDLPRQQQQEDLLRQQQVEQLWQQQPRQLMQQAERQLEQHQQEEQLKHHHQQQQLQQQEEQLKQQQQQEEQLKQQQQLQLQLQHEQQLQELEERHQLELLQLLQLLQQQELEQQHLTDGNSFVGLTTMTPMKDSLTSVTWDSALGDDFIGTNFIGDGIAGAHVDDFVNGIDSDSDQSR